MRFKCQPVSLEDLKSATSPITNQVTVNATPETIFRVFEDPDSWPKWVDAIDHVEWTSPKPYGAGTTRTVTLSGVVAEESFILWDHGKRMTFYFTAISVPFAKSFCEDYRLESVNEKQTIIHHTLLFKPNLLTKLISPVLKPSMKKTFRKALLGLSDYLESQNK